MNKTAIKVISLIILILAVMVITMFFTGCNRQMIDLNYNFNYAIINTFNGTVEGKVTSWRDFDDGDQLQVTIDGVTYLTSATNVILEHR
jgi:hypothetical protein